MTINGEFRLPNSNVETWLPLFTDFNLLEVECKTLSAPNTIVPEKLLDFYRNFDVVADELRYAGTVKAMAMVKKNLPNPENRFLVEAVKRHSALYDRSTIEDNNPYDHLETEEEKVWREAYIAMKPSVELILKFLVADNSSESTLKAKVCDLRNAALCFMYGNTGDPNRSYI